MGWDMASPDPRTSEQIQSLRKYGDKRDDRPLACSLDPVPERLSRIVPLVRVEIPGTGSGLVAGVLGPGVESVSTRAQDGAASALAHDGQFFWGVVPMAVTELLVTVDSNTETCAIPHLFDPAAVPFCSG